MDAVETVRNLPLFFPGVDCVFHVHPDPIFDRFRDGKKLYKGEALILTVSALAKYSARSFVVTRISATCLTWTLL